jgi:dihydroorotase
MANTKPATDTVRQARAIKQRSDALGLIDLYPALSLTKKMEGKELSEITMLENSKNGYPALTTIRLLSEDGKDLSDDEVFLSAMKEGRRIGVPVSCHCDLNGENSATKRALELGRQSGCRLHIAHVSTREAAAMIREAKKSNNFCNSEVLRGSEGTFLSCEVTPHHLALTEKDAAELGTDSHGRVNPPLRTEKDRQALIEAVADGTVDAIATDHAPHTRADKENGAPGFSGLETAFAVCYSTLVVPKYISLSKLSSIMSAAPARILRLDRENHHDGRGLFAPGLQADFAIADLSAAWTVEPALFKSHGKNSAFIDREFSGKIVMTIRKGVLYDSKRRSDNS